MIAVADDKLSIHFDRFDLDAYKVFIQSKQLPESQIEFDPITETYRLSAPARFATLFGLQAPAIHRAGLPLPSFLFDYQREILAQALTARRFAAWWDCGLGKTNLGLEWCRQLSARTGGRGMILTLKELIPSLCEEMVKFYRAKMSVVVLRTRAELIEFCNGPRDGKIGVTNYEKFINTSKEKNSGIIKELKLLSFLWADESSVLKCGGGVIKWNLIKSARGIEYKLSTTATPAPNDIMEYASQAAFLEKIRSESDVLWTYFTRDKNGEWKVRPHAQKAFYRFMAGWSIYLRNPARYGWKDNTKPVPVPIFMEHRISATDEQLTLAREYMDDPKMNGNRKCRTGELLTDDSKPLGIVGRGKLSQLAKGFIYLKDVPISRRVRPVLSNKPKFVADICNGEMRQGHQVIIWTQYDEETAILHRLLPHAEVVTGSIKPDERAPIVNRFKSGATRVLITRPDLLGFGQNFQMCGVMIFSAFTDSYEDYYQAVRRAYRYGCIWSVRIHIPFIPELEGAIWENLARKAKNFESDTEVQEVHYIEAMMELRAAA